MTANDEWTARAACRDVEYKEIFFPDDSGPLNSQEARLICAGCEVRGECLEFALKTNEQYGIWGGLNPRERRRMETGAILRFKRCAFCKQLFSFAWEKGKTPTYCNDLCRDADRKEKRRVWRNQSRRESA